MTSEHPLRGLRPDLVLGALASLPGAFWLRSGSGTFAGALPSARKTAFDPEPTLLPRSGPGSGEGAPFPRWVGALPYESVRSLERTREPDLRAQAAFSAPVWQRYDAVVRFEEGQEPELWGSDRAALERLEEAIRRRQRELAPSAASLAWAEPPELEAVHEARVERALELISRGELYQVNLARRFFFQCSGHPFDLLCRLTTQGSGYARRPDAPSFDPTALATLAPFALALDLGSVQVISASPESFLELGNGGFAATRPIKGTRPRHPDPERDRALALELDQSDKERAELAMVIDIERNDLGRVALPGTVRLAEAPSVVSLATVHHRQALVTAQLSPAVSREQVILGMMPSGSVTGAPKVRAMDLIRELEAHRRGLYTGALGTLGSDGRLELSMAIRCLVVEGSHAEYFSGGGIVADSNPKAEVQETLWKAEQLVGLLGGRDFAGG